MPEGIDGLVFQGVVAFVRISGASILMWNEAAMAMVSTSGKNEHFPSLVNIFSYFIYSR